MSYLLLPTNTLHGTEIATMHREANKCGLKPITLAFTIALSFAFSALPVPAQEKITIGLVPEMNVFAQAHRFEPLATHLTRETGIEVRMSVLNRYSNIIEELRQQKIDAAFLGSFTAAIAISQLGATPVARPINLDGTSTYHGLIFARKDSKIVKVSDMQNKSMAFVERSTTAGYIFPLAWLKRKGVPEHKDFFQDFFFAGSHDAAIDAVMTKKADIGAAKNTIFQYYLDRFPKARSELTVIAKSTSVPSNGLCVTNSVSKDAIIKIQTALLSLDRTAKGREVLETLRAKKFVETRSADYAPVFDLITEAGISMEMYLN